MKDWLNSITGKLTLRTVIAIVISLSFFFGIYYGTSRDYKALCDASGIAGAVSIGLGIMSLVNYFGFFDFASYGFISVFSALRKDAEKPYDDLVDYKDRKAKKRKTDKFNFIPYIVVGIIFIVLFVVFENVYYLPSLPTNSSASLDSATL